MTPCPSDDVLGALVQQVLGDVESEQVRLHIDECGSCAQAILAAVRGGVVGTPSVVRAEGSEPIVVGAKIGRYDVRTLLGAGGMGHVYEAYDAELDRAIALKVLRPELAIAQTLTERLVRESRLMAKVSHPAVIAVFDVGRAGATVFIAMELIRGQTLGAYLAQRARDWRATVELFERAGGGLAAAHRAGIVHRDFKPDNVLVEVEGAEATRVVVTDFGIARATSIADDLGHGVAGRRSDPRMTSTGGAIGTPAYMAPEQLDGNPVDLRADVFAFAASLWEALFGVRPFPGESVAQIRDAMTRPPQAPGGVPRGLVRALAHGLAIDPAERWQDMHSFVRELARLRGRRRRVQVAAGMTSLVTAGVAGALLLAWPTHDDPCERATLAYDEGGLRAAIADAGVREVVVGKIETAATAWRATHRATCKADRHPAQPPKTMACLDARKLELNGLVTDLIADRGTQASKLVALLGDPTQCLEPAPSLLTAKVPADPALRRKVTALRYRAFAAETARDRNEFKRAMVEAAAVVDEAAATWPFQHAEALYLLGTVHAMGGDTKLAMPTLRQAAAVAETAHHDYIAANAWIQLVLSASFDQDAPERGLEYATYAEAALERLGRPPLPTSLFEYARGATLTALSRFAEAEVSLRRSIELAQHHALAVDTLPEAIQGLGFLFESQGRYTDAIEMYRTALAKLPAGAGSTSSAIIFRQRLAVNLALTNRAHEAEAIAREAVVIAERMLPAENLDRALAHAVLAEVLQQSSKLEEALDEARIGLRAVAAIEGERSGRYGEVLQIEAEILHLIGRHTEAAQHFARACDIVAFHNGEGSGDHASCELAHSIALTDAHNVRAAFPLVDKALPDLLDTYGEAHPQTANALLARGALHVELGRETAGIADLERAVTSFEKQTLEPGYLGASQWALAKALWKRDNGRARSVLEQALQNFGKASLSWTRTHAEAAEWLASNGKSKRH